MLRDRRLRDPKAARHHTDRGRAVSQALDNPAADRMGNRPERIVSHSGNYTAHPDHRRTSGLPRRRLPLRPLRGLAAAASRVLVLYGGVLVVVGASVVTGVINPAGPVDRAARRWHVLVWDSWFLLWGLLLGLIVVARRRDAHHTASV